MCMFKLHGFWSTGGFTLCENNFQAAVASSTPPKQAATSGVGCQPCTLAATPMVGVLEASLDLRTSLSMAGLRAGKGRILNYIAGNVPLRMRESAQP